MASDISFEELCNVFLDVVNRFNEMDRIPYFSGKEITLHLSEVHMIEAIGNNENINVTNLAKLQGVTKGFISQAIHKLVKKGCVLKAVSPETENEVVLRLTEKGREVYEWHRQYHEQINQKLAAFLSEMPEGTMNLLGKLGIEMGEAFSEIIRERTKMQIGPR